MDGKFSSSLAKMNNENSVTVQKLPNMFKKDDTDVENDDFEEDKIYDETMQDQDTETDGSKIEYRRKLLEIPAEMLPCPNRLSYEASYSPPTQDEVKYYKTSASAKSLVSFNWLALIVLGIVL